MISYLEALSLLKQQADTLAIEQINTCDSLNRILSCDIISPIDLPSFDNSAMDGFALKADETILATPDKPVLLLITEVVAAEIQNTIKVASKNSFACSQIMTGATIPTGYDAVIPIELVEIVTLDGKRHIKITASINKFSNVRFKGEDVKANTLILQSGNAIKPADMALLLSLGIASINVFKQLNIAIASSGDEISDQYNKPLKHGEIYNSNSPLLLNLADSNCFNARYVGILADESKSLHEFIANSTEQILITTGAVSKGEWDFIPDTLRSLKASIIFHGVAIRPGKPILFARLLDGRYFLGLPGNPVSCMVGWRFFALPLFYAMWGRPAEQAFRVRLKHEFKKKHQLKQFLKADMHIENGIAYATIDNGQESFKIKPLTTSNIWAIVDETTTQINANDFINVLPLYANL